MKTSLLALALCAAISVGANAASEKQYAISVHAGLTTELVFVYGPTSCDPAFLERLREVGQSVIPPSLTTIGYVCASRDEITRLNLNPPVCGAVSSQPGPDFSVWEYECPRGILDRFVNPPPAPTAAEMEQRRTAQEAALAAQQQAAQLAAQRAAERSAWQRYAATWAYQRQKASCSQHLAHRMPGADNPEPFCENSARSAAGSPTVVFQYCAYMRSTGQPERTIHAACDTGANVPFNVLPPKL